MSTQSVSWQRRMLEHAAKAGDTDLVYFLEMTVGGRTMPAAVGGIVQVIVVGSQYDSAPEYAHLLLEVARSGTPGARLATALTTRALLDELIPGRWREWESLDVVCEFCGGINCPVDCLPAGYSVVKEVKGDDENM